MAHNTITVIDLINQVKVRIAENNLTMKELSDNVPVDEELLRILLDDSNGIVQALSDLTSFMKIKITGTRRNKFNTHRIVENGDQVKISRILHPRCSIIYDKVSKNFYKFKHKNKEGRFSNHLKQLIINEMASEYEKYLHK